MFSEKHNSRELNIMAEEAKKRAEVARYASILLVVVESSCVKTSCPTEVPTGSMKRCKSIMPSKMCPRMANTQIYNDHFLANFSIILIDPTLCIDLG